MAKRATPVEHEESNASERPVTAQSRQSPDIASDPAKKRTTVFNAFLQMWARKVAHEIGDVSFVADDLAIDSQHVRSNQIKAVELRHRLGNADRSVMDVFLWMARPSAELMYLDKDVRLQNMGYVRAGSEVKEQLEAFAAQRHIDIFES